MTKAEHATFLQGLRAYLESLEKGTPEAIEAVKAGMVVTIINLENMCYCESCKQILPSKDMENSRYCSLCVAVMDYQDTCWTDTEKDLRLGGIA